MKKPNTGREMDDTPVHSSRAERPRPGDLVDIYAFPEKKYARLRLFGPVFSYGGHWITTKKREGGKGQFFMPCLAYDPATGRRDPTIKCPWCAHGTEDKMIRFSVDYFSNGIVRGLQKNAEDFTPTRKELKTGFKDKESETWTPVRAIRLSTSVFNQCKDLKSLNVHEGEDGESVNYAISHPKFGCDVMIKFNGKDAPPATKYVTQKGDHSVLKKLEKTYLTYDLSNLQAEMSEEEAAAEYKSWAERNGLSGKSKKASDDEDDEDDAMPRKKKKVVDDDDDDDIPAKKPAKRKVDDDDDEDDVPPPKKKKPPVDEDDDEDDDIPPPKKRKTPPPDDDDDEEDLPVKKKPVKKAPVDDDEDEDEDDAPPKKAPAKKKPVIDDEDDEDDVPVKKPVKKKPAVEDDDEDDAPPPKKRKTPPPDDDDDEDDVPAPKKKRKVVEEDEEDEDEAPPPKKKKKVVEEDDDDL